MDAHEQLETWRQDPPAALSAGALKEWNRLLPSFSDYHLTEEDLPLLRLYCQVVGMVGVSCFKAGLCGEDCASALAAFVTLSDFADRLGARLGFWDRRHGGT